MKKVFLDTEFTSLTQSADLISIALVSECGKSFYGVFKDFNVSKCSAFVQQNVIPFLNEKKNNPFGSAVRINGNSTQIKSSLEKWFQQFQQVEIWADVPHYDWVFFCELFGGVSHIPSNINYRCLDLCTLLYAKGISIETERIELIDKEDIPKDYAVHNALSDAQVGIKLLLKLMNEK